MALEYRAFSILYVDSDAESVLAFRAVVSESFVFTAAESGREALQVLGRHDIAVLVVEQQLSDMTGVELLRRARELRPTAVRLLTSRAIDLPTALDAINLGQVQGYLPKPWQQEPLRAWLGAALDPLQLDSAVQSMGMSLWHGGQVAAATTIYEELVHELSNPLGALEINASLVSDLLQTALGPESSPEVVRESLEVAREAHADSQVAIVQMKTLVARMRHGRRPTISQLRGRCDVVRVIDATVRIVRAEIDKVASLELLLEDATRSVSVAMDASVLGQVLLNLLLNSAQAVPEESRAENRIRILVREAAGALQIAVEDNGPGIAPEHLERVFEPFFTTKENGTGLGLAICRELVSQCRGTIRVQQPPGGGVRFAITVPIAKTD